MLWMLHVRSKSRFQLTDDKDRVGCEERPVLRRLQKERSGPGAVVLLSEGPPGARPVTLLVIALVLDLVQLRTNGVVRAV